MGKQTAVVVRHYNKENPVDALDVVDKNIPEPKSGISLHSLSSLSYLVLCHDNIRLEVALIDGNALLQAMRS